MSYLKEIQGLIRKVPVELVDFDQPRETARVPTQVTTNFITNKEQGDWAERVILQAINGASEQFVAVKYGRSDDMVAGDEGWGDFYQSYQIELDSIGKRPDLLIFNKTEFNTELGFDISSIPHDEITDYVKKAVAGVEVRSSAFLLDHYEAAMQERTNIFTTKAIEIRNILLNDFPDIFEHSARSSYVAILEGINPENLNAVSFRCPSWGSCERLIKARDLFKELKDAIKEVQKRDFLSITPKVEDLKVVNKWIETFGVPHFYFQVFFDKVYGISFKHILEIISNPNNEGEVFSVESDVKNQNKTTIKINSKKGVLIASRVDEPSHKSVRKELARGRLLFYVTFEGGAAYIDWSNLKTILEI